MIDDLKSQAREDASRSAGEVRSPKSEVLSPKSEATGKSDPAPLCDNVGKVRSSKSEVRSPECEWDGGDFWTWGDEPGGEMSLNEGARHPGEPEDLEERATRFGEEIIRFAKRIPQNPVTFRLIDQLIGAGTSIGANYVEAKDGFSRKDFKNRVGTSRKESKETMFFLRMIATAVEELAPDARVLWREARELNRIFGSIWRS